jgi:hypothetical protein
MSETNTEPIVMSPITVDPEYLRQAGMYAMNMVLRPRWKFAAHDGSRRRFHDRTPRPALNLKIVENPK